MDGDKVGETSTVAPSSSFEKVPLNFLVMNWHQVLMRTGWIFKTESLVMPAVFDLLGGGAWLRGTLPMLNRFGQSIPPLLAATSIRNAKFKKYRLIFTSTTMGLVFCSLAMVWNYRRCFSNSLLIITILVLYGIFFSSLGINQVVLAALTGKMIPVQMRGRLMQASSVVGSIVAILCAWILLKSWLSENEPNFSAIFLFAGLLFVAAGLVAFLFREHPDEPSSLSTGLSSQIGEALHVLRQDHNFRILACAVTLFGMMMTLFPHYQAIGRERLRLGFDSLVPWIISQNLGVALFSLPAGWVADRHGNRIVLKFLMFGVGLVPILSLIFSVEPELGRNWYFLVFGFLGLTPVAIRSFHNYTLELVDRQQHPKYLSLLSLFLAGPAVAGSLVVGLMIDMLGYEWSFLGVSCLQFLGFGLCFLIKEPRKNTLKS